MAEMTKLLQSVLMPIKRDARTAKRALIILYPDDLKCIEELMTQIGMISRNALIRLALRELRAQWLEKAKAGV